MDVRDSENADTIYHFHIYDSFRPCRTEAQDVRLWLPYSYIIIYSSARLNTVQPDINDRLAEVAMWQYTSRPATGRCKFVVNFAFCIQLLQIKPDQVIRIKALCYILK